LRDRPLRYWANYLKRVLFLLVTFSITAFATVGTPTLRTELSGLLPGHTQWVSVHLALPDGWHTYNDQPGEVGFPPTFNWDLPEGLIIEGPYFLPAKTFKTDGLISYGYEKQADFLFKLTVPESYSLKTSILKVDLKWLVCKTECLPETAALSLDLPLLTELSPSPFSDDIRETVKGLAVTKNREALPQVIGFGILMIAFIGGVILNVMPCVFPILSLKILSLTSDQKSRKERFISSLAYLLGIVVSFWVLAGVLFGLKYFGLSLGWGFQLQSPIALIILVFLFFLMSMNLFGVFEVGVFLTQYGARSSTGFWGMFGSGVLSTIVATPCSAPFVGTAVGLALTQPGWMTFFIFSFLGLGLAFPFVLLSVFELGRLLPRSGAWMVRFKQFLGFPMLATVGWFMWVLGRITSLDVVFVLGSFLLILALISWVYGEWGWKFRFGWLVYSVMIVGLIFATIRGISVEQHPLVWEVYSPTSLQLAIDRGEHVLVSFTADWCVTCQINERRVFKNKKVHAFLRDNEIKLLKADWTSYDPEITQALAGYGRSSVPLVVYYAPNSAPVLLPELLAVDHILSLPKKEGYSNATQ